MTREEAKAYFVERVQLLIDGADRFPPIPIMAFEMAIEALKDESLSHEEAWAEIESDLISRTDAIRWVKTECNQYGKPTLDYDSGLKVIEHLKKMPSELPSAEAVQGEWIVEPFRNNWEFKCSVCGWHEHHAYKDAQRHNFCPNCGARMVTE